MRLYYGTYGHHLSGKLYVYWGDDNLRTGQQVIAPVTHYRSGKNYNTMFTIARAQSVKNAQGEVNRLGENGIFIKTISGRDLLSLPGGKEFETKIEWKRDSDRRYRQKFGLPEPEQAPKKQNQTSGARRGKPPKPLTAKKAAKAVAKFGKEAMSRVGTAERAKQNLRGGKTAADSFHARERVKKLKQREAFIED